MALSAATKVLKLGDVGDASQMYLTPIPGVIGFEIRIIDNDHGRTASGKFSLLDMQALYNDLGGMLTSYAMMMSDDGGEEGEAPEGAPAQSKEKPDKRGKKKTPIGFRPPPDASKE